MKDSQIIELYWSRSENAISRTADKYGTYCRYIAFNILHNNEDSEECVNDTYLKAWNAMPPHRPELLSAFLGKITRNISLDRYKQYSAQKRGAGQIPLVLEELQECVPSSDNVEQSIEESELTKTLNCFITALPEEKQKIFLRRYWYLNPIKEIAADFQLSESKVKMVLLRIRNELRQTLEKEGIRL